jgi:hypothetical protein
MLSATKTEESKIDLLYAYTKAILSPDQYFNSLKKVDSVEQISRISSLIDFK